MALQPARSGSARHSATPQRNPVLIGLTHPPATPPPPPDSVAAKTLRAAEGTPNGPPFPEPRIATPASTPDAQDETDLTDGKYPLTYSTLQSVMVAMHHRSRHEYLGPLKRSSCPRAQQTLAWKLPPAPIRPPLCNDGHSGHCHGNSRC